MNPLSRGLIEMLGVVGAFVALGLLGQGASLADPAARDPIGAYPREMAPVETEGAEGTLWLVDGYNVLCSGVLGGRERGRWWAEEHRGELLARLEGFDDPNAEIWVVFDGSSPAATADGEGERIRTVFAPSADDWLVAEVKRRVTDARAVAVVTADRRVAGRSRHRGAQVFAPRELLGRCTG
jgi:predicted RNA-binding protein with PIN domain